MRDKDLEKLTEELLRRGMPEGPDADPNLIAGLIDGGLIEEEQTAAEAAVAGDAVAREALIGISAEREPERSPVPQGRLSGSWPRALAAILLAALGAIWFFGGGTASTTLLELAIAERPSELFGQARGGPIGESFYVGVRVEERAQVMALLVDSSGNMAAAPLDGEGHKRLTVNPELDHHFGAYPRRLPSGRDVLFVLVLADPDLAEWSEIAGLLPKNGEAVTDSTAVATLSAQIADQLGCTTALMAVK